MTSANINPSNALSITLTAQWSLKSTIKNLDYTGNEQTYTIPYTGYYKLEVWGAQGGTAKNYVSNYPSYRGGYGAYSVGVLKIGNGNKLYIDVGGGGNDSYATSTTTCGQTVVGNGYNGGSTWSEQCQVYGSDVDKPLWAGGGGGATHIATVSGKLVNLKSYKDTGGTNVSKQILIVASGGGGGTTAKTTYYYHSAQGGNGGGISGNNGNDAIGRGNQVSANYVGGGGATQTGIGTSVRLSGTDIQSDADFGKGCTAQLNHTGHLKISGGAGWYGGGCGNHSGGGGGSGYIGSSNLISGLGVTKHMTCYSCTTSTAVATRTNSNTNVSGAATADYSKTGNGYARITWMGDTL